jgi:carbon monoxide dehydrogenase subunit G
MAELVAEVDVDAPPRRVWDRVVDWERQQDWVPATKVRTVDGDGHGVGGRIEAWTGVGRVGFLDPMVVTEWSPPHRCAVRHTGRVVRGTAAFEVVELPGGRSRFVWSEWLELPLGVLGQLGWTVARPLLRWGLRRSLRTFARQVTAR